MIYNIPTIKSEFSMNYNIPKINLYPIEEEFKFDFNAEFKIPYRIRMINMDPTKFEECVLDYIRENPIDNC